MSDKQGVGYGVLVTVAAIALLSGCFLGYGLTLIVDSSGSTPQASVSTQQPVTASPFSEAPTLEAPATEPVAGTMGTSRSNPAVRGTYIDIGDDLELAVIDVLRPATTLVAQANQFNATPEPGQEYIQVTIGFTCKKASDATCVLDGTSINLVGRDGNIIDQTFVSVDQELRLGDELFGGAKKTATLVYLVRADDSELVLFYDPVFSDSIYFSLR